MKQIQDPITTEKNMEQDMCKRVWKIEGRKDNRIEDFERILECFINGGFLNNHQIPTDPVRSVSNYSIYLHAI